MATDIAKPAGLGPALKQATINPRRGAKGFFVASTVAQACALIRYTVLARLLGPEQLGLAASLVLTSQFFNSITDSGSDRFLIQDREGDAPQVQGLVQLVWVGRGVMIAAALVLFAGPIAAVYKTPALATGLMGLGLSALIFGFVHLDMRRAQRHNDFRTEGVALLAGESLGLAATVAAAYLTHSFTAIVYGLVVRSLAIAIVSHVRAHRPYALVLSKAQAPRLARFAAPLMLNGLLLFFGQQGDRIIVGGKLGLAELGLYSAVILLIFYPTAVLMSYLMAIHLPRIAAGRDDAAHRDQAADALGGQALIISVLTMSGFTLVGPIAVTTLYGARFAQSLLIICLIGILQSSRFIRTWPNTVALGIGRSGTVLTNNVVRLIGAPLALAGAVILKGLPGIVIGLALGEFAALATGLVMVNRAENRPILRGFDRVGIFTLVAAVLIAWSLALGHPTPLEIAPLLIVTGLIGVWVALRERATIVEAFEMARRLLRRGG